MSTLPKPFKKLHPEIQETLLRLEQTIPTAFQEKCIPAIKSGANLFCTGKKESGKTTTLILTTLQKLKHEAVGTAPRAFVLVEDMEKAQSVYAAFVHYARYSTLRIYLADEKVHIDLQKSEIFEGIDILIATSKSLNTLFLSNGVTTSQLKIFSIDDAEYLAQKVAYSQILSITQSVPKCQYVLYSEKLIPGIKRLESYFMEYSRVISS